MWEINVTIGATWSTAFFSRVQTKKQTLSQQVMLSGGGEDRQCYPCGMRAGHLSLSLIYFSLASLCLLKSRARQRIASLLFPKPGGVNQRMRLPLDFTATILWLVTHQPHILISIYYKSSLTIGKLWCLLDWGIKDKLKIDFNAHTC